MRHPAILPVLVLVAAAPGSAAAPKKPVATEAPAAISRVVACSAIADPAGRLACFDREVAAMSQAQRSGDLVAMDRQQVRKTRRSLFGLALPNLGIFGDDAEDEGPSEFETTIKSARIDSHGAWILDLTEGGRWVQIDSRPLVIDPEPGHKIKIRRAALGSYMANINKQVAIRVRRVL